MSANSGPGYRQHPEHRLSAKPASAGVSMKSVSCAGVSPDVWKSLEPSALQALDPNSAAIVLSSFSKLLGDTIAEGRATAGAQPKPVKP